VAAVQVWPVEPTAPQPPQFWLSAARSLHMLVFDPVPQQTAAGLDESHARWLQSGSKQSTSESPSLSTPSVHEVSQLEPVNRQSGSQQSTRPSQSLSRPSLHVNSLGTWGVPPPPHKQLVPEQV